MKDLEDRLAESLGRQGASVTPASVPFDDVVHRAHRRTMRRRTGGAVIATALLVAGGIGVWSANRTDDGQVTVVDEPTTLEDGSSLPAASGTWTLLPPAPLSGRSTPSVVWTGTEFIVWGGHQDSLAFQDGAAYDPAAGTWRSITPNSWAHPGASAVWDGTEMIVVAKAGGAAYNPATDTWRELPRIDLDQTGGYGLEHVMMAGDDVVAVTFGGDDDPFIRLWRLTDDTWEAYGSTDALGDQGWDAIGLPDGVALWNAAPGSDGNGATVTLRRGSDWVVAGPPTLPEGAEPIGPVRLVMGRAGLTAVSPVYTTDGPGTATVVNTLGPSSWSEPVSYPDFTFSGFPHAVSVGGDIAVFGPALPDPVLLRPPHESSVLSGSPLETTLDQGFAASDDALFIWGGHGNSDQTGQATGAIWTRSNTDAVVETTIVPATTAVPATTSTVVEPRGAIAVVTNSGEVLDLAKIEEGSPPDRVSEVATGSIQGAHLAPDGRFVITTVDGTASIVRPDGTVDDTLAIPVDPNWSLVDTALGPFDVLYNSESSIDPTTQNQSFRFTAIPTTGSKRGERVMTATSTEPCVETWCGQVVLSSDGVRFTDLGFYVPPEFGLVGPVWPALPTMTATAGDLGEMDPSGTFTQLTELVTVTQPDGSILEWRVRVRDAGVAEGSSGTWLLQADGSVVGMVTSADAQYLVSLRLDGSSQARRLGSDASDVYAAFQDERSTTLVVAQPNGVALYSYDAF